VLGGRVYQPLTTVHTGTVSRQMVISTGPPAFLAAFLSKASARRYLQYSVACLAC